MFFSSAFVLGLAATAAARVPSRKERLENRLRRRGLGAHQSNPRLDVEELPGSGISNSTSPSSDVSYSQNWAGCVISEAAGTWKAVTGTFTVPTPSEPSGGSSSKTYSASAWVGIDGDTCDTAILQTGVDFSVKGSSVSYDAWYEWYPDYAYDFSGISFSAGDSVTLTVTASSTTKGSAKIENTTTGKTVTKALTSSSALCEKDAEWIVEDYEEGSSLVPLADFGTVTFSDAKATTSSGTDGPSAGTLIDIKQSGTVYTTASKGSDTCTVKYSA